MLQNASFMNAHRQNASSDPASVFTAVRHSGASTDSQCLGEVAVDMEVSARTRQQRSEQQHHRSPCMSRLLLDHTIATKMQQRVSKRTLHSDSHRAGILIVSSIFRLALQLVFANVEACSVADASGNADLLAKDAASLIVVGGRCNGSGHAELRREVSRTVDGGRGVVCNVARSVREKCGTSEGCKFRKPGPLLTLRRTQSPRDSS